MAKFTITDHRGGSTGCTGQLLNDLDEETQVPYFLTATHCVKDRRLWSIELYCSTNWTLVEASRASLCGSDPERV